MTDFLLVSPIIVPLLGALVLIGFWGNVKLAKIVSLVTVLIVVLLAFHLLYKVWCEGILVTNLGNWDAPFGIVLVADLFAVLMVSVTALISLMSFTFVVLFHDTTRGNYIHPFLLMLLSGVNGVFMTGDLFNLFVFRLLQDPQVINYRRHRALSRFEMRLLHKSFPLLLVGKYGDEI